MTEVSADTSCKLIKCFAIVLKLFTCLLSRPKANTRQNYFKQLKFASQAGGVVVKNRSVIRFFEQKIHFASRWLQEEESGL